jgi:hypothetical protein
MSVTPAPALGEVTRHVEALCAIGNRYIGTPGEAAAQEHVLQHFRSLGLRDVHTEPVRVRSYKPQSSSLQIRRWPLDLECHGLQGTANGTIEAHAVFLGGGETPADVFADEARLEPLEGRIAVFQSHWPWESTAQIVEQGAVGIILISQIPENRIAHLPACWYGSTARDSPLLPVPGVVVGADTGRRLVAALAGGATQLRLSHECDYPLLDTVNVMGTISGETSEDHVVIAAHHDTFIEGVGAHDNATGLGGLLALASAWSSAGRPRRSVELISFAAEEVGLCGAEEYCRRHRDALGDYVAMVNLDALAWRVAGERCLVVDDRLRDYAVAALQEIGWPPDAVQDARGAGSDVAPFMQAGVPSAWCWRHPPQHVYFASDGDAPEFLDLDLVIETAAASGHLAWRIATEPGPFSEQLARRSM